MAQTFDEIKQRIKDLKARSGRGSITVAETFSIIDELLEKTRYVDINQGSLTIKVVYSSVAEMMADTEPRDQNGRLLKYGQLACIATGDESEDNGKVYSFQDPGWLFVDRVGDYNGFVRKEKIAQAIGSNSDMVISQAAVTKELNERITILPYYGDDVPDYVYNTADTGSGNGKVYYDSYIQQFVSIEGKIGYKYWGGNFPHTAYSLNGHGILSKNGRLYFNPDTNKVYFGGETNEPILYNFIHNALGNNLGAISQKAVTDAFNNLSSKIVDAKDVLPFDGFDYERNYPNKSNDVGIGEGDVFYDDAEFRFFKIIENVLYHDWEGEYPNISYSLDGSAFRTDKVYVNIGDKKSYTGSMDGTPILISNVLTVYQTMGTSTSGTISQKILTQKFDTIDKGIFNNLGVLGEDFNSLDEINTSGTYQYIVKGPVMPGRPQATYNYRLFVVDNLQLQISSRGIMNREYLDGVWSEWKESGSAEDIKVLQSLVSVADDKATSALEELNRRFPFKIQTFSGGKIAEKGTTVSTILNWSYDGIPVSQGLTRNGIPIIIDLSDRSVSINDITENLSCVLTANGLTATQNISFYNCRYVGAISDVPTTESQVKALTKLPVSSGRSYTWTGSLNDQRICFAYPKSFGALSSIRDANNFEYVSGFSRSEVMVNSELYYVYVSGKHLVENFKYIFS